MDGSKLICPPTLSVVLVKTIKALCEINIKYDSKLEITGSLHVRSDGQKVMTCLLDEETTKGQHDAARIAELAARFGMAAATFPFTHLQMTPSNHSQQVAEALLSSMQGGDVHLLNPASSGKGGSVGMAIQQQPFTVMDSSGAVGTSQLVGAFRMSPAIMVGGNASGVYPLPSAEDTSKQCLPGGVRQQLHDDTRQSAGLPLQQCTSSGAVINNEQPQIITHHSTTRKQRQQQHGDVCKMLSNVQNNRGASIPSTYTSVSGEISSRGYRQEDDAYNNSCVGMDGESSGEYISAGAVGIGQNHVKLPDMQTLAHSLPKYPVVSAGGKASKVGSGASHLASSITQSALSGVVSSAHKNGSDASVVADHPSASYSSTSQQHRLPSPGCSPASWRKVGVNECDVGRDAASHIDPNIDPMMSINIEVQSELDNDGVLTQRKRFQCMFCGIFLSTKCYLKNHVNAMHTRARVYPCELCERYFYSAGALRIHKLRNHWHGAKKHVCMQCGETFLLPIELRKHALKKHCVRGGNGRDAEGQIVEDSSKDLDPRQLLMDTDVDLKLEDGEIQMPLLRPVIEGFRSNIGSNSSRNRQPRKKRGSKPSKSAVSATTTNTEQQMKANVMSHQFSASSPSGRGSPQNT